MNRRFFSLSLLAFLFTGCTLMPSYRLLRTAPHKDVLHCVVHLDERAEPEVYQRIALQEIERIRAEEGSRRFPLYEVTFEFLDRSYQRLAKVMVFPAAADAETPAEFAKAPPSRLETILY